MTPRHWSKAQLDRVLPPQAADARGRALVRTLDALIGGRPIREFHVRAAETCPAEALPALIAEYSMEEFVDPGLPEHVQRRILTNAWHLQSLKGYDAGVKLGLSLLGMTATIEQWHAQTPMGPPDTHRIVIMIDDVLYPDAGGYFAPRQLAATQRMIDATKRWSQDSDIRFGVVATGGAFVGAFAAARLTAVARTHVEPPPVCTVAASFAVVPAAHIASTLTTS